MLYKYLALSPRARTALLAGTPRQPPSPTLPPGPIKHGRRPTSLGRRLLLLVLAPLLLLAFLLMGEDRYGRPTGYRHLLDSLFA